MPRRPRPRRPFLFAAPQREERPFLLDALRQETVGGALLLAAAVIALVWANSPWHDTYEQARHFSVGPLTLEGWAADGLLTIFFYVAGLELKRELVTGSLRHLSRALVPLVAAVAGMVVPALLYVGLVLGMGDVEATVGWAVPMATDIAFALAVLAVAGSALPPALRAFLLTLAVVDDLGAITVIAVFFTESLDLAALALAVVLLGGYAVLQHRRVRTPLVYVPLALAVWWLTYQSGIHATVAGVALGLLTRVRPDPEEKSSPAERLEHRLRPLSAGVAVPVFALAAAGVPVTASALGAMSTDAAALGVIVGLVVGKCVGVFGGAWLTARLTHADLSPDLTWRDIVAVGILSGIGFTVCLLISDLAFGDEPARLARIKAAVLLASLIAALAAAVLLRFRQRTSQAADTSSSSGNAPAG
ncbi:Na+/H+ antiporter NhaA [Actinopolymorpha sp. B11F2]|uniref:Na+/H+ antiporter NhaA n=1 Tax=Actinopolymorpha sp. B11F2 TaxID=3160862 RepID=UPI0032E37205